MKKILLGFIIYYTILLGNSLLMYRTPDSFDVHFKIEDILTGRPIVLVLTKRCTTDIMNTAGTGYTNILRKDYFECNSLQTGISNLLFGKTTERK